mgnify:CR=1 FL=1|jgi:elongation factor P
MSVVSTNELRTGMTLDLPEGLMQVVDFQHVKPGKGGAFVRTTLKNIRSGRTLEKTFRSDEKVGLAMVNKKSMQYVYRDGTDFVMMDNETFEQENIKESALSEAIDYIQENDTVDLIMVKDEIIGVDLPTSVDLEITETDPGLQGDRSTGGKKPATVITGLHVQVPLFVNIGDKIKVDTRTGEYVSKA